MPTPHHAWLLRLQGNSSTSSVGRRCSLLPRLQFPLPTPSRTDRWTVRDLAAVISRSRNHTGGIGKLLRARITAIPGQIWRLRISSDADNVRLTNVCIIIIITIIINISIRTRVADVHHSIRNDNRCVNYTRHPLLNADASMFMSQPTTIWPKTTSCKIIKSNQPVHFADHRNCTNGRTPESTARG